MADFVLDESCYIRALYAQRTDQDGDWLASRLLQLLQAQHRWVFTSAIIQAYFHQIKKHAGADRGVNALAMIRSLRDVERDAGRCLRPSSVVPVPGDYDHDDDHMVEAAAAVPGSLLITLDARLTSALIRADIPIRYGFSVLDVSGAWELLRAEQGP